MDDFKKLYYKHRQKGLPVVFILATIFVFLLVVRPQIANIQETLSLLSEKRTAIEAKEKTISILTSLPDELVNENYSLTTSALPIQKDIIAIFEQLNSVSTSSNVALGGFNVNVGGVYDVGNTIVDKGPTIEGIPYLNIKISVSGQSDNLRAFAENLYKSFPIVEIKQIDVSQSDARYDVNFFYKPIVARPQNNDKVALESFSPSENEQIEELKKWK